LSDLKQKLKERAQLAVLANRISDFHAENLRKFPFVFFDNIKSASIDYDFGHAVNEAKKEVQHGSRVCYRFTGPVEGENMEKRFQALEAAVRNLFWRDVKVEVYINDEKKYESKDVR